MRAGDIDIEVCIIAAPFSLGAGAFPSANGSTSNVLYSGAMQIGNQQSEIETRYALYRGLMTTGGVKSRAGQISGEVPDSRAGDARQWLLGAMRPHVFEQKPVGICY